MKRVFKEKKGEIKILYKSMEVTKDLDKNSYYTIPRESFLFLLENRVSKERKNN